MSGAVPYRGLLFDLDGTLVDSERESAEAMARALAAELGIAITQEDRDRMIGHSWVEIYREMSARYPALTWTREQLIAATAAERSRIFASEGVTVLPGAREVIARFRHVPLGLVTGSSREEAAQALVALGMRETFGVVIAAEDVGSSKPSPEGYAAAARALGLEPANCVVIEESTAGIAAGVAAGARVVAVRAGNFAGQDQSGAHLVIDTLDELTHELLARLCGMVW
jgi:HAD superfamily hydrolase (TIGR01509 family)